MDKYDEDDEFMLLTEMNDKRTASYIRGVAFDVWHESQPLRGGPPAISVQKSFTLAEDFVAEAKRRGY